MQKSIYGDICDRMTTSMKNYFNKRKYISYFYYSLIIRLVNRMQCHPTSVYLFKNNVRNLEDYKLFQGVLREDEGFIFDSLLHDENDVHFMMFSVTFSKNSEPGLPYSVKDEICIQSFVKHIEGGFYFGYAGSEKDYSVTDYNNEAEMTAIVDAVINSIYEIYSDEKILFSPSGLTYRDMK